MNGEAGKGDTPRPKSVSEKEYAKRFYAAFGRKKSWFETRNRRKWITEHTKEKTNG